MSLTQMLRNSRIKFTNSALIKLNKYIGNVDFFIPVGRAIVAGAKRNSLMKLQNVMLDVDQHHQRCADYAVK